MNQLAPLLEAVEYEQRDFESGLGLDNSGFTGLPTAEMEAKWESLSQGMKRYLTRPVKYTYC